MRPRPVYPGDVHLITRRVNAFLCRLRPGEDVRSVVVYCLGRAARRHGIQVLAFAIMSTHVHLVVRDPRGVLPCFCQEFFENTARALNFAQETGGCLFEPGSYKRQTLETPKAIYKEIAYTIANPVAAGLVSEPCRWPGLITLPNDLGKRTYRARRPKFFQDPATKQKNPQPGDEDAKEEHAKTHEPGKDPKEPMWDEERLTLCLPHLLPDGTESTGRGACVRKAAADWLARELEQVHAERKEAGAKGWLGVDRVTRQDPRKPYMEDVDTRPTRGMNPQFVTQDRKAGHEADLKLRAWRGEYREVRARWSAGDRKAVFPHGTWLAPRVWGAKVKSKPA